MNAKKETLVLAIIFLVTFGSRLYFAFDATAFTHDAYSVLRQVEYTKENLLPLSFDELSYGGRELIFSPLFTYFLAFFNLFMNLDIMAKIIPNLLASAFVLVVYLITKSITKSSETSLFTSFISGFIPIFFSETFNSLSVYSVVIPLIFLLIYFFLKIKEDKKYITYFLVFFTIASLLHSSTFLLVIALLFYLILSKVEGMKVTRGEVELVLFSFFLLILIQVIIYKKAFLLYGPAVVWQNIPPKIMKMYFADISILEAIYKIGLLPFLTGIYIVYRSFFKEKRKSLFLLISFVLTVTIILWLKFIDVKSGLFFLGAILVILFGHFFKILLTYIKKTKFAHIKPFVIPILAILFIITSVFPSLLLANENNKHLPTKTEIESMLWLNNNTDSDDVILASVREGYLITFFSKRQNVFDLNFLLAPIVSQRVEDVDEIYTTHFKTNAIELLNKYNIKYVYISHLVKEEYNIEDLTYVDKTCFLEVFNKGDIKIYKSLCRLEE